jgi:hypothetical protein
MADKITIKERIFGAGHRVVTLLGVLAGGVVALGQYLDYVPAEYRTSKWYAVAAALVALGAALKMPGQPPKVPIALLLGGLLFAAPARAAEPVAGGCLESKALGHTCFGLDASFTALAFKEAGPRTIAAPSLGYAISAWADKWYKLTLPVHLGIEAGDGTAGLLIVGLRFANVIGISGVYEWVGAKGELYPALTIGVPIF